MDYGFSCFWSCYANNHPASLGIVKSRQSHFSYVCYNTLTYFFLRNFEVPDDIIYIWTNHLCCKFQWLIDLHSLWNSGTVLEVEKRIDQSKCSCSDLILVFMSLLCLHWRNITHYDLLYWMIQHFQDRKLIIHTSFPASRKFPPILYWTHKNYSKVRVEIRLLIELWLLGHDSTLGTEKAALLFHIVFVFFLFLRSFAPSFLSSFLFSTHRSQRIESIELCNLFSYLFFFIFQRIVHTKHDDDDGNSR